MDGNHTAPEVRSEHSLWCRCICVAFGSLLVAAILSGLVKSACDARERDENRDDLAGGRAIVIALILHSADEPEKRIEKLDDLMASGHLKDDSVLYRTLSDGTKRPRWIFLGYDPSGPGEKPVIISAEAHHGRRFVYTSDTSVELMRDDPADPLLRDLRARIDRP